MPLRRAAPWSANTNELIYVKAAAVASGRTEDEEGAVDKVEGKIAGRVSGTVVVDQSTGRASWFFFLWELRKGV